MWKLEELIKEYAVTLSEETRIVLLNTIECDYDKIDWSWRSDEKIFGACLKKIKPDEADDDEESRGLTHLALLINLSIFAGFYGGALEDKKQIEIEFMKLATELLWQVPWEEKMKGYLDIGFTGGGPPESSHAATLIKLCEDWSVNLYFTLELEEDLKEIEEEKKAAC